MVAMAVVAVVAVLEVEVEVEVEMVRPQKRLSESRKNILVRYRGRNGEEREWEVREGERRGGKGRR